MRLALVIIALLLSASLAPAREADLAGRWQIRYYDVDLGPVRGWARIDPGSGSVRVTYADPGGGPDHQAEGSIRQDGDRYIVTLRGSWPNAGTTPPPPGRLMAAEDASVLLDMAGDQASVPVVRPPPPPSGEIRLDLALSADGRALTGPWTETVDAATARDGRGKGRLGSLRLLHDGKGGAVMEGMESWSRPELAFVDAFALNDQMAADFGMPRMPEPFAADGRLKFALGDRRTIFVLGRDLPAVARDLQEIVSDDPLVEYTVRALPSELRIADAGRTPWIARAWDLLKGRVPPERMAELRAMDAMLIEARFRPGTLPGAKTFAIEGVEAAWLLQFGDWRGRLSVARPIGFGQAEDTDFIYSQERMLVEIMMDREVPLDEIPIMVGVAPHEGEPRFGVGGQRVIAARRDRDEARRYVTEEIVVSDPVYADTYPAGTAIMAAMPGDQIAARLGEDEIIALDPPMDAALVLASPRAVKASLTGDPAARGRTWEEALRTAAACHGMAADDIASLDAAAAETFNKQIVFAWTTLSTDIALGEHAAAILLRDTFVQLLAMQARDFARPLSDEELIGFRRMVRDTVWDQAKPLGDVRVRLPDGSKESFAGSFVAELMQERHGLAGEALEHWQVDAARQARQLYAEAVLRSREIALAPNDCDTERLIALTGFDFAPVRAVAKQTLATFAEEKIAGSALARPAWTADRRARAWIDRVAYSASTIAAIREVSEDDNVKLLTGVMLCTLPLAFIDAPLAMTAMYVVDLGDVAVSAGNMALNVSELQYETRFATGAAAVLGTRRYVTAEARRYDVVRDYFSVLASAGGAALGGTQLYEGLVTRSQRLAIKRGEAVAQGVTLETLVELNLADLRAIREATTHALTVATTAGRNALTAAERKLVGLADAIVRRIERPGWAIDVPDEAWRRLKPIVNFPHISRAARLWPKELAALADAPDAADLMWRPFASLEEIGRAIAKQRGKVRGLGEQFYEDMSREFGTPLGIRVVGDPQEGGVYLRVLAGKDNDEVAHAMRQLKPDWLFSTDGSILEFTSAMIEPNIDASLRMVQGLASTLTPKGTPLGVFLNLRAANDLGVAFADPRIRFLKLSYVVNVNTCVQMDFWLRHGASLEEAAWRTFSVGYARDALELMGLRAVGAEKVIFEGNGSVIEEWAKRDFFDGEDLAAYTAAHGLKPDDTIGFGYDIYLRVEPIR